MTMTRPRSLRQNKMGDDTQENQKSWQKHAPCLQKVQVQLGKKSADKLKEQSQNSKLETKSEFLNTKTLYANKWKLKYVLF